MKLMDTRDNSIYVQFDDGVLPRFADPFLEKEMHLYGIEIPPRLRKDFNGKEFVVFRDEDFPRAFRDVYYLYNIDRDVFQWRD